MATTTLQRPQCPLIIRCHRLLEAFAKSDDERDFFFDRSEGFLVYVDLDKPQDELDLLYHELHTHSQRYTPIPKLTFYETKKIMEGFANEKVYDIDTKDKLLDIIQSKDARENFLEFLYDHHAELERWQQYYQERFRVRMIEWLRQNDLEFVFEEDLELPTPVIEHLKRTIFETKKLPKDVATARQIVEAKAKTYYSTEALNPRPKRGRPPKQILKVELEPTLSSDYYLTVAKAVKPFLFVPPYQTASVFTFSGKYSSEEELLAHRRQQLQAAGSADMQSLTQKLAALRAISSSWRKQDEPAVATPPPAPAPKPAAKKPAPPKQPPARKQPARKQPPVRKPVRKPLPKKPVPAKRKPAFRPLKRSTNRRKK